MHFDGMETMAGRHLVFAYAAVILIQGGYFLWLLRSWLRLDRTVNGAADGEQKKATKPAN